MNLINKTISRVILFWMFVLMTVSSLSIMFLTISKISDDNIKSTKHNLNMLSVSIFQTLRHSMNTGDPAQIEKAEKEAASIKGIQKLYMAKSKKLIELYAPNESFTNDSKIQNIFNSKKTIILEQTNTDNHSLRMIKPMIATQECLMCHANQSVGEVIGVMDLTFSLEHSDESKKNIMISIILISTILGWLTIGIIFYVVTKATKPIEGLKDGFVKLIESKSLEDNFELKLNTKGEIAEVAHLFNQYMNKVQDGLKKDAIVIDETNDVLQKVSNGFFSYEVKSTASNPHVEELKNNLNIMIKHLKQTLDKVNTTLQNYSQSKYDYKMEKDDIFGDLGLVTNGIKLVGNNTSELLAVVLNAGNTLKDATSILSESSAKLAASVEEQSHTGGDTTIALDNITRIIQENTEKTVEMSTIAKHVTVSAQEGQKLATSTSIAMNDISVEVTSINEAIKVIDQIAFQTNILSLNAAVEAATAGEAGKGFAVVAQEVRNLANRSAEAAKDIKQIVENATIKANNGKEIADNMILGYKDLSNDISDTLDIINRVSSSSKEQEKAILKINTTVVRMSRSTKNNASVSKSISDMSVNIANMSTNLVDTALKSSFIKETQKQVCNVELMYSIADLKVQLLKYCNDIFSQLSNNSNTHINKFEALSSWIKDYQSCSKNNHNICDTLNTMNESLYNSLKELTQSSNNGSSNSIIIEQSKKVEVETNNIFETLNKVKEIECS